MPINAPFKVSAGLKDLIGQDLITDDFVAIFELVKNSFDAHATLVEIFFTKDAIVIADNGKGMSESDILGKWLFVAYSAKRDGTEDRDYRNEIGKRHRAYAGAKGVGRFSCDRLGTQLRLSSRSEGHPVQVLDIDWTRYEKNAKQDFGSIDVELSSASAFPDIPAKPRDKSGTVLQISGLRSGWDRAKLQALKRELAKLINPFAAELPKFQIEIIAPAEQESDHFPSNRNVRHSEKMDLPVNGIVENQILAVLGMRTTSIQVRIIGEGKVIETKLEDRGELIYRIREQSPYVGLRETALDCEIYFLNRKAKSVFARRMGIPSVEFGSIFVFRNGFRVFPIGDQHDDFFGLTRRKQQGVRRFLGSRDLIGRVEVQGAAGFNEATSRNQGLIRTPAVDELIACVRDKCVRRLERYVVDITWKDQFDKDSDDTSRMRLDESSARITQLVSRLADTDGVDVVEYSADLVRVVDEKSKAFESSLNALELLAEKTGDDALARRVGDARDRIRALQKAEAEAREAERRAKIRANEAERAATAAKAKYHEERQRNDFLVAAGSLDQDTIMNLHHQIIMHASDVHLGVRRMMGKLRNGGAVLGADWVDFLERVSFRNSQILTASRFATKGGYRQQSSDVKADLAIYIADYVELVSSLWAPRGMAVRVQEAGKEAVRSFRPIEVGIMIDNLVSNAAKANAERLEILLKIVEGPTRELSITVADDGFGWDRSLDPIERVLEKGVTTTDGSGLGLYHVKQVVERLGGVIEVKHEECSRELDGAQLRLRVPI